MYDGQCENMEHEIPHAFILNSVNHELEGKSGLCQSLGYLKMK